MRASRAMQIFAALLLATGTLAGATEKGINDQKNCAASVVQLVQSTAAKEGHDLQKPEEGRTALSDCNRNANAEQPAKARVKCILEACDKRMAESAEAWMNCILGADRGSYSIHAYASEEPKFWEWRSIGGPR